MNNEHFEQIYIEHKRTVYNVCLNYLLNTDDAQDATQEVFVKIYQQYHKFNPEMASSRTWVYRIAVNQCLDIIKSKKTNRRFGFVTALFKPETNILAVDVPDFKHPGIITEGKEEIETILKIIYALPENQKNAIILTKLEDRPQKEVAEIMNMSIKAVESLLHRAKQTILKKLTDREGL